MKSRAGCHGKIEGQPAQRHKVKLGSVFMK